MKRTVNHEISDGIKKWAKVCVIFAYIFILVGVLVSLISLFEDEYGAVGIGAGLVMLGFSLAISRRLLQGFSAIVRNTEFELATGGDDEFLDEEEQPENE